MRYKIESEQSGMLKAAIFSMPCVVEDQANMCAFFMKCLSIKQPILTYTQHSNPSDVCFGKIQCM